VDRERLIEGELASRSALTQALAFDVRISNTGILGSPIDQRQDVRVLQLRRETDSAGIARRRVRRQALGGAP